MLFNISKQAVNPGRNFGAYGLPKAALMFMVKQLSLKIGGAWNSGNRASMRIEFVQASSNEKHDRATTR